MPSILKRLSGSHSGALWDDKDNVLHVSSAHSFLQAAGYLKHALRQQGPVFCRGQTRLYPPPTYAALHRGISSEAGFKNRQRLFSEYFRQYSHGSFSQAFLRNTPEYAHEPLLQHYGLRTKWLDLVDNVWVALWFACHEAIVPSKHPECLHFDKCQSVTPSTDQHQPSYAYIIFLQAKKIAPKPGMPGVYTSSDLELIDLRVAAPSLYLRPHAQHGLLVKRRNNPDFSSSSFDPFIVGVLRVRVLDAQLWLGDGSLGSTRNLFPPPHYDLGYSLLLRKAPPPNPVLGTIQHVGA